MNTICSVVVYSVPRVSFSSLELGGQKEMDWHTYCVLCSCTASATQQCEFKDLGHNPCGQTRRRLEQSELVWLPLFFAL